VDDTRNAEGAPRHEWRLPALVFAVVGGLAAVLALAFWAVDHDSRSPGSGRPTIISVEDPNKAQLFARALSCPTIRSWAVDFAGNGSPYRVDQNHCDRQELSAFKLPRTEGQVSDANGELGYDFLLVFAPSRSELIDGEMEEGSYGSVEQVKFQGREYVAMNGMVWGTSGDHDYCLLGLAFGLASTGRISCLQEQKEGLYLYVKRNLRPDEDVKPGWNIEAAQGALFMENYVEAKGDPNCCPSRGKIRVGLMPRDGRLYWGDVTRSGPLLHDIGEEVTVGYWTYRCNGVRWQDVIFSDFSSMERPDAAFLIIDLSARNNDRTASTLPPPKLIDADGREYDESSTFIPGSFSALKRLNPTVSSRGYVVFDAPRGDYKLKLSGGYESEESALIDLGGGAAPRQ
jgi:hypothetical protein